LAPPTKTGQIWRFGVFEVDTRREELRRSGTPIKLREQSFRILIYLLEHPDEIVTREELRRVLWPSDTFVDFDHSLNTAVMKLREALGDSTGAPQYIETIPKRGYRFIAPVETVEANSASPETPTPTMPGQQEKEQSPMPKRRWPKAGAAAGLFALLIAGSVAFFLALRSHRSKSAPGDSWTQITNFADSATQPALSPDGHMIAFIRGAETFVTPGQIYVKILPDGEPVQLTHDPLSKMAPVFSPDGSRIAYTTVDRTYTWNTWVVPVLGGEPRQLIPNAAALTWPDPQRVLFSEVRPPDNVMSIVAAAESRAGERKVYVPAGWGMAHRSWPSPDGKWVLISEMDVSGWMPCRVVPFDGSSQGQTVGPNPARCTYAGWSPDGKTMYFSADAGNGFHIWRQTFPNGDPEQITAGATEEEGIAVSPDGRSLVTSAGIKQSTVWVHDIHGDRQISSEGFASIPGLGFGSDNVRSVFSPDGKKLYYLVRKQNSHAWTSGELWSADLDSGQSEVVLPGITIDLVFDIASDGKRVIFKTTEENGISHVSVASLDRLTPPQLVTASVASSPGFGPAGQIYFVAQDGAQWRLHSGAAESSALSFNLNATVSPLGNWWITGPAPAFAHPVQKGPDTLICNFCSAGWGPGGRFFLRFRGVGEMGGGKMIVIALHPGQELPMFPQGGLNKIEDAKGLHVVAQIDMSDKAIWAPGPDSSVYAYTRVTVQRNLYRIQLK
jgi:DNA-binding winged helix-turn-helix (wHTH) protein/Tol biopolymer transport system component